MIAGRSLAPDDFALFPLIACTTCGGERLAFKDLDSSGELVHVCALCGGAGAISRWVDDSVLSAQGLRVRGKNPVEAKLPKTSGCSKSGSCGSSRAGGGCSSGSCGTCSSGGCGK
ncbi:MAG: hypothetical protein IT381_13155 [Deltaproteobacteria bacterium]|nr:hypothetical protein [Deltaproteobacteria bacterium]